MWEVDYSCGWLEWEKGRGWVVSIWDIFDCVIELIDSGVIVWGCKRRCFFWGGNDESLVLGGYGEFLFVVGYLWGGICK